MQDTLHQMELTPGILSVLPLFYIGWSDSVLSPSEMDMIHDQIQQLDFLTKEEKAYLIRYTDPLHPPSEATFKMWADTLKARAQDLDIHTRRSLATLGLELAKSAVGVKEDGTWTAPKTKKAVLDIQASMGLEGEASADLMMAKIDEHFDRSVHEDESFDPKRLQEILDGEDKALKDRMRKLLRDPFFAYQEIRDKEAYRQLILEQVKALGTQGLGAYAFPKKYGGGERKGEHITVFEMLAYGDLSRLIKFGVQFGLFGGAVYGLGTERHHRKYVEALGKAELLGCFAMTETGHGSNVKGLETTATYDSKTKEILIHSPSYASGKEYIGNAMHSTMSATFAQLIVDGKNHGVHCILVPLRDAKGALLPGIKVEDCGYKMGLNGVDNGRIWYNQVRVPKENLLNRFGDINEEGQYFSSIKNPNKRFFTMLGALVAGRVCVGLASVNTSKSALTIAIKYAMKRRQFAPQDGEPELLIMDYPSHQRRLLPLLSKTYAYYFALDDLSKEFAQADEDQMRAIETKAAGLKAMASWHATESIQESREACGGKGYLSENRLADLKADTDIFTTFEGDNYVLLQLVAKGLLTEFKQSFHDEGFRAVIRYLSERVSQTVATYNPVYTRNTNAEHLLDRDFHKHAFRYREKKLLITLSERMQDYLKKRIKPFDAFLKCQTHMVELAKAYVERLALKSSISRLEALEEGPEKIILSKVIDLFALSVFEENKGWYLESGYVEGVKTKAIRRMINKLCAELKTESIGLVEAFGIPDELLGAEIVT